MTFQSSIEVSTEGCGAVLDVTPQLRRIVTDSAIRTGHVCVANPGSTAGITTVEFEPGTVQDLGELLELLVPRKRSYHHDATWGDANGFAHMRSALIGASLCLPVVGGEPVLGVWQQVVICDFDNRPRTRKLVVVVVGDPA
jgi:secondary thiamine-phosphate synthase enzyme